MAPLLLASLAVAGPARVHPTSAPIRIDGVLDEPAWAEATPVTDFARFIPTEGGPPPGRTDVRFLQDAKNLYVGIRVTDNDYPVRARISRREDVNADDQVGIYLDTFRDGRTGYIFYFNGHGIQQDIRVGPGFSTMSWDTVLRTKGTVHEDGFHLEVAIPWRSIKYPDTGETQQEWGLIVTRKIPAEGAKYSYPRTQRAHPRLFTQAAPLVGVRPAPRGSGFEIIPSLTFIQQAARREDGGLSWVDLDPSGPDAARNWLEVVRPSLDVRLGITPNLGLATTLNPDFSQVDQDPTFVDLNQRFAFFLPERRPFFLDGIETFDDQHDTLYTRSIVDPLYGAKLSGRQGKLSIGVLHALDRDPAPTVHERDTPGFGPDRVDDAWAVNDVLRLRHDAFGEGFVGITLADKRLVGRGARALGNHTAVGADMRLPLGERWNLDARTLQSFTGDGQGERLWGQEVGARMERASGIGWGTWIDLADRTLGHRMETGFLNQSGITLGDAGLGYTFEPDGVVDTLTPSARLQGRLERNGESQVFLDHSWSVVLGGIHRMSASGGVRRIVEGTGAEVGGAAVGLTEVRGGAASLSYNAELGRVVTLGPYVSWARTLDFNRLVGADVGVAGLGLVLRPTPGLRFDTTLRADRLARDDGSVARATVVRNWTSWQFTQALGLRSLVEHTAGNERDDLLVTTLLLTWLHDPWTAIHAGWIERTALEGGPSTRDRSVFLKASVLFRP